jgi:uncharacterized protein YjbJ (UPF0337 family)
MAGKIDEAKGRAKKAAGEVTGNQSLKDRGSVDKGRASVKRGVDKVADKAQKGIRRGS